VTRKTQAMKKYKIRYGPDARTTRYKKYTIIYNVDEDVIYIRRIIASSLIT
jgi:hypothetical protein